MKLSLELEGIKYAVNPAAVDLSIPLLFNGPQPNSYGVPAATAQAFEGGGFVGDVRRGGSCNFESYTFIPHCNGTHTECVGHITAERVAIHERLRESLIPACVISIEPVAATETEEAYIPELAATDRVITAEAIVRQIEPWPEEFWKAMIIRTLPNDTEKKSRDYTKVDPPFFTSEAMLMLRMMGIEHLLVDTPSVDRLHDEGILTAHHIYWDIGEGGIAEADPNRAHCTITEFIYVPDEVVDGIYLLNLQVAPFVADAAPSRPRLFSLSQIS